MIAAGRFRRDRVEIQREARSANGQGGYVTSWAPLASCRAEVVPMTGNEDLRAGAERSIVQYRVTIRRRDVTAKDRLAWRGQTLEIRAVVPHREDPAGALLLTCETAVKAGV